MGASTLVVSSATGMSECCGSSEPSGPFSNGAVGLGAIVQAVNFQALSKTEFHENELDGGPSAALGAEGSGG